MLNACKKASIVLYDNSRLLHPMNILAVFSLTHRITPYSLYRRRLSQTILWANGIYSLWESWRGVMGSCRNGLRTFSAASYSRLPKVLALTEWLTEAITACWMSIVVAVGSLSTCWSIHQFYFSMVIVDLPGPVAEVYLLLPMVANSVLGLALTTTLVQQCVPSQTLSPAGIAFKLLSKASYFAYTTGPPCTVSQTQDISSTLLISHAWLSTKL